MSVIKSALQPRRSAVCLGLSALLLSSFVLLMAVTNASARGAFRQRLSERISQSRQDKGDIVKEKIGGIQVAIWCPKIEQPSYPLVVFSHGFHGRNDQSISLMKALSAAGYLVMAPNHRDAMGGGSAFGPEVSFKKPQDWNDNVYSDRKIDFANLLMALRADSKWGQKIDWKKIAYVGHSLGGYTALGLAGAWPSWRRMDCKAVIALSPYCQPYVLSGHLDAIGVPVMYQGGTRDLGVTPFVKKAGGAFDKTKAPAYYVEFDKAGHLAWSNVNKDRAQVELINHYCVQFLDKYINGDQSAQPEKKLAGVTILEVK